MSSENEQQSKPKKGSRLIGFLIGAIVIVVLFLIGIVPKILNSRNLDAQAKQTTNALPIVQAIYPRMAVPDSILLPGNVQAIRETSVQARSTGYVSKLYVDIGSHVKQGQILADVESPDLDQQLVQAQQQANQSQATVSQSQANVQSLQATTYGAQAEVHHQLAALIQAKAALAGARSAKEQAESNVMVARARVNQSQHQVEVQREALNTAQANFNLAEAQVQRYQQLLAEGYVAQQDYDQQLTTYKTSAAAVASAKAAYSSAEADEIANEESVRASMQAVRSAQSTEDSAEANIKAGRSLVESATESLAAARSNLGAGQHVVQANAAALASNVANARRYGVLQSFEHVTAPFDGIITARNVDAGSLVSPGAITSLDTTSTTPSTGLFGIAQTGTLRIYVNLPQDDFEWAPPGRSVSVMIRELPDKHFQGVIHQTAGALDSTTRTLQTEVRLPNPGGILLPGMYAEVEITPGNHRELRVPSNAILMDAQGSKVVVIDDQNRIHYRKVVLGRDYGVEAEILRGLGPKDRIVANASDNWNDGQQVQIQKPKGNQTS